jgi:hypothetical protein
VVEVGVAERGADQEPVELRLGQPVGSLEVDRVLGGQDEERIRRRMDRAADGDGALLHHLEQGRLGLGRGPVDLVGQHHVREHRAGAEGDLTGTGVVDRGARDITGKQVGGELDAA